ncbi:MAG: xanthine dehydrogenase family protein subunit M [Candidatus Neomarinimicrobiota bacterium]
MKSFQYLRPETLNDALTMLGQFGDGAKPLLGGTDLMVRIQKGQADLNAVIDLKRVQDIGSSIEADAGMITVGARVVLSDLVRNEHIQKFFPALADAASTVGSIQIRNRATLVGNICNASPAADTVPALMVHGASVTVAGRSGKRSVPLKDFFLGPGKTVCRPSELAVSVHIPLPGEPFGAAFGRLTRRKGVDLATINLACGIDAKSITTFVFGAVGPAPITAIDESGKLARTDLPELQRDEILKSLIQQTSPISDVRACKEYRQAMLLSIGRRVLLQAQQRYGLQAG